jgi:leucyl-tRNA synthetase
MHFNTAVAAIMELVNAIYDRRAADAADPVIPFATGTVVRLLAPFAPHLCAELWEKRTGGDLEEIPWPDYDEAALVRDTIEVAVQVNGKVRSRIQLAADAAEADAISLALADAKVAAELAGRTPKKTVYVKGRLVSVVV